MPGPNLDWDEISAQRRVAELRERSFTHCRCGTSVQARTNRVGVLNGVTFYYRTCDGCQTWYMSNRERDAMTRAQYNNYPTTLPTD